MQKLSVNSFLTDMSAIRGAVLHHQLSAVVAEVVVLLPVVMLSCIRLSRRSLLPAVRKAVRKVQAAGICHKDHIDEEIMRDKPAPWPYDRKRFNWWHKNILRIDRTVERFDENSVVVTVEGPMAVGKHDFGVKLADLLGMRYYGEATVEPLLLPDDGFDRRTLNWLLPESAQLVDQKMFYLNPRHRGLGGFIINMYCMKYFHYLEGLTHLFNTGQGVVHERSPYSDFIFVDTLTKLGFCKPDLKEHYNDIYIDTNQIIHRPHLVIYLDIPAEESMRRFLAKSPDHVKNSPLMTLEYFQTLEDYYKKTFLPLISKHAEVLIYDWQEPGDMDMVIEDIEKIDFVRHDMMTEKLEDWRHYKDTDYDEDRMLFSYARHHIYPHFQQPDYDKPSTLMSQEAVDFRDMIFERYCPRYEHGFDPKIDKWWNIMLKPEHHHYRLYYENCYFGTSCRDQYTQLQCV